MSNPFPGRANMTVDATNLAITVPQAARLATDLGKGNANGVAALDATGKVVDSTGTPVVNQTKTSLGLANVDNTSDATKLANTPLDWPADPVTGLYAPRPATGRPVYFRGSVAPPLDGTTAGGAGAVPGLDGWWAT